MNTDILINVFVMGKDYFVNDLQFPLPGSRKLPNPWVQGRNQTAWSHWVIHVFPARAQSSSASGLKLTGEYSSRNTRNKKYLVFMFWFTGLKRPRLLGKANAITTNLPALLHTLSMGSRSGMSFWPCGTSWPGCVPSQFPILSLATVAAQKPEKAFGSVLALPSNSRTALVITPFSAQTQTTAPCEGQWALPSPKQHTGVKKGQLLAFLGHQSQWGGDNGLRWPDCATSILLRPSTGSGRTVKSSVFCNAKCLYQQGS